MKYHIILLLVGLTGLASVCVATHENYPNVPVGGHGEHLASNYEGNFVNQGQQLPLPQQHNQQQQAARVGTIGDKAKLIGRNAMQKVKGLSSRIAANPDAQILKEAVKKRYDNLSKKAKDKHAGYTAARAAKTEEIKRRQDPGLMNVNLNGETMSNSHHQVPAQMAHQMGQASNNNNAYSGPNGHAQVYESNSHVPSNHGYNTNDYYPATTIRPSEYNPTAYPHHSGVNGQQYNNNNNNGYSAQNNSNNYGAHQQAYKVQDYDIDENVYDEAPYSGQSHGAKLHQGSGDGHYIR